MAKEIVISSELKKSSIPQLTATYSFYGQLRFKIAGVHTTYWCDHTNVERLPQILREWVLGKKFRTKFKRHLAARQWADFYKAYAEYREAAEQAKARQQAEQAAYAKKIEEDARKAKILRERVAILREFLQNPTFEVWEKIDFLDDMPFNGTDHPFRIDGIEYLKFSHGPCSIAVETRIGVLEKTKKIIKNNNKIISRLLSNLDRMEIPYHVNTFNVAQCGFKVGVPQKFHLFFQWDFVHPDAALEAIDARIQQLRELRKNK